MNPMARGVSAAVVLLAAGSVAFAQSDPPRTAKVNRSGDAYLVDEKARFADCMKVWDATTHMTRKEWERTCRRVTNERVKYLREQGYGADGTKGPPKAKRSAR